VIDPTKVTRPPRCKNAASVATLLLTSDALIADKPKKEGQEGRAAADTAGDLRYVLNLIIRTKLFRTALSCRLLTRPRAERKLRRESPSIVGIGGAFFYARQRTNLVAGVCDPGAAKLGHQGQPGLTEAGYNRLPTRGRPQPTNSGKKLRVSRPWAGAAWIHPTSPQLVFHSRRTILKGCVSSGP